MVRGFAALDKDKQKQIASRGGKAAHAKGKAHQFTSEEARIAGKKGGQKISQNREHMQAIGRKGGTAVSANRAHMSAIGKIGGRKAAEIGRAGGQAISSDRNHMADIGRIGGLRRG